MHSRRVRGPLTFPDPSRRPAATEPSPRGFINNVVVAGLSIVRMQHDFHQTEGGRALNTV
jgi:hypothetical protein